MAKYTAPKRSRSPRARLVDDAGETSAPATPSKPRKSRKKRRSKATSGTARAAATVKDIEDPIERAIGRWMVAEARGGHEGAVKATRRRIGATSDVGKLRGILMMLEEMGSTPDIASLRRQVKAKLHN